MTGPVRLWPAWMLDAEVAWEREREAFLEHAEQWELDDFRRANGDSLDVEREVA